MAASSPAAEAIVPAAEPDVCVILHSSTDRERPMTMNSANPRIAAISDPPNDQPIFKPM